MMHPSCNINSSTNLYYNSRPPEENYYYYYSSPSLFPSSPLYHLYTHDEDAYNNSNINNEEDIFQDFVENHHEMMQPQQQNPLENDINDRNNNENDKCKRVVSNKISISPRKKNSKAKIQTAQGPRDRRMRLSLSVARKFFDLQDMLGFDKASQTVEWLLKKSISSISELSRSFNQEVGTKNQLYSTTSQIAMIDEFTSNGNLEKGMMPNKNKNFESKKGKEKEKEKVTRTIRPLARKSREEARKRARERTKEKMMSNLKRRRELDDDGVGNEGSLVGENCWIPSSNTILHLQQNGGIVHGLTNLPGNLGVASIW